ncbi:hypothetical protein [Streptosporangium sp. NPDC006007]|uniref:hypothetical protein n=1 Tax=Streptosporangium sp. NPDC006007 TaxID=3154575 RepID=UPI0033B037EB
MPKDRLTRVAAHWRRLADGRMVRVRSHHRRVPMKVKAGISGAVVSLIIIVALAVAPAGEPDHPAKPVEPARVRTTPPPEPAPPEPTGTAAEPPPPMPT